MKIHRRFLLPWLFTIFLLGPRHCPGAAASRLVILKVDGLNADLLYSTMRRTNPQSGKSVLPWLAHIFQENGAVFENFYTRGISLSAPSWSMLDSGHHTVIRGNVEYDRYTGYVYDYLNFFPFYIGNARAHTEDMPGVQVLDRAGIPLVIDSFRYPQIFQSFQLFQRGVRWVTLEHTLKQRFSSKALLSIIENGGAPSLDTSLEQETERELLAGLTTPEILYLDFYTGDVDHEGHATNDPATLESELKKLDGIAGRIWTAIQANNHAIPTIFAVVSDHGMNNVPGVFSQAYSLPDLLSSPQGGAHHVVTNRHQLSDYKLMGLNPLVSRVIAPSTASFYLAGQSSQYPTAWLDLDGNERASLHLRNSDLNLIQILLQQLAREDLAQTLRAAAVKKLLKIVDQNRASWTATNEELQTELAALRRLIEQREQQLRTEPKKWSVEEIAQGDRVAERRAQNELQAWEREEREYTNYVQHIRALLSLDVNPLRAFKRDISDLIPELCLGNRNSIRQLQHYVVGPATTGLILNDSGEIDDNRSFRFVDYFSLLVAQRVRNNPQAALSSRPIDFVALALPDEAGRQMDPNCRHAYWLYADNDKQLVILENAAGEISTRPIIGLKQGENGSFTWESAAWQADLPLHLFEDPALILPQNADPGAWLSGWHDERTWFEAIHKCAYSNGVIGVTEQFSPVGDNVPGMPNMSPTLLRYERRRRELVQPDLQIFAADHWNFNARNFNPGGNHGGFFRISTHSVWMMAGDGIPTATVSEPYDSLNFASTLLNQLGKTAPMPKRVVNLP